jgi:hypothetical protein
LCGYCKCSHIDAYAALSKTPHALADGLMLVFQHPVKPAMTVTQISHDFQHDRINRIIRRASIRVSLRGPRPSPAAG